jgi:hypothetical protein
MKGSDAGGRDREIHGQLSTQHSRGTLLRDGPRLIRLQAGVTRDNPDDTPLAGFGHRNIQRTVRYT